MGILGQEIKERRASMNLTQGELGELLGVALNTVSRWENGSSSPESGQMLRLALDQIELNYTITLNDEARDAYARLQKSNESLKQILKRQKKDFHD